MIKLTSETLNGIWAGVTMPWDENYCFDEDMYAKNIQRAIDAKVSGIYTTGSTGEFYALDYDEFCRMVDIQSELCGNAGMPLQIGCCSDSTAETIKLLEYAAGKRAVTGVQVNIPYWMELDDRELLQFFKDLYMACPDMPLIHYNIPRAKRFLLGRDYKKILEVASNLIGVKFTFASSHFGELQEAMLMLPNLSFFVGESLLVSAMQLGAKGSCSSLVLVNPRFILDMYAKAQSGQWEKAIKMQQYCAQFVSGVVSFVSSRGEGMIDPTGDNNLVI